MRTSTRLTRRLAVVAALALVLAIAPTGGLVAADEDYNTCKDHPAYDENYGGDTSGDWGSIAFSEDDGPLVLDVNETYEVWLCLKKGSDSSDLGVVEVGPFVGPLEGVEVNYPGTVPAEGFSHYGVRFARVTTTTTDDVTTTTQPATTTTTTDDVTTTTQPATTTTTTDDVTTSTEATTTTTDEEVEGIVEEATTTAPEPDAVDEAVEGIEVLPRTGATTTATTLVAIAALLTGAALLAAVRRRQLVS